MRIKVKKAGYNRSFQRYEARVGWFEPAYGYGSTPYWAVYNAMVSKSYLKSINVNDEVDKWVRKNKGGF